MCMMQLPGRGAWLHWDRDGAAWAALALPAPRPSVAAQSVTTATFSRLMVIISFLPDSFLSACSIFIDGQNACHEAPTFLRQFLTAWNCMPFSLEKASDIFTMLLQKWLLSDVPWRSI